MSRSSPPSRSPPTSPGSVSPPAALRLPLAAGQLPPSLASSARFQPIPQGPPSPSFLKSSYSGKSRPSTPLLPTSYTSQASRAGMATRPAPRRAAVLVLATLIALLFFLQLDLDVAYEDAAGDMRVQAVGFGRHLREHLFGHASAAPDNADDGSPVQSGLLPETEIVLHAPGWTVFENLYQLNTTFYVVMSNASAVPPLRMMTSPGREIWNSAESIASREPTDKDMQVITPAQALELFTGQSAIDGLSSRPVRQVGPSWIINDPPQFLAHFYHWAAEGIFGLWRTFSALDPRSIQPDGHVDAASRIGRRMLGFGSGEPGGRGDDGQGMSMPRRMIFTHTASDKWQDYSGMNALLMRAIFPKTTMEMSDAFEARARGGRPIVYDQVVFADRAAAMRGDQFTQTMRTASEAFLLPSSPFWWSPIRRLLLAHVGAAPEADPVPATTRSKPVITYISRQNWNRRKLVQADHDALVATLTAASEAEGWEFVVADMEKMPKEEQVRLAARTTIMMGVHGNGLTHLLWMKPSPSATVLEFFYPKGWAFDYEFIARGLGIAHFGFWNDRAMTSPDLPQTNYPEGFQGDAIPISADAVLRIVRMRLNNDEEADDG